MSTMFNYNLLDYNTLHANQLFIKKNHFLKKIAFCTLKLLHLPINALPYFPRSILYPKRNNKNKSFAPTIVQHATPIPAVGSDFSIKVLIVLYYETYKVDDLHTVPYISNNIGLYSLN